jgi:hypothetical protein
MKQRMRPLRSVLGVLLLLSLAEPFAMISRKQGRQHQRSRLQFSTYHDNGTTELLEALLYEADMGPLRMRQREYAYQRRRLGEQLRLNKMSLHSQRDYAYQRRRLGEQLRLNQKRLEEELRLGRSRDKTTEQTDRVEEKSAMQLTAVVANKSDDLSVQLEILKKKVDMAVQPPPANTTSLSIYNKTLTGTNNSLLEMLSDTHLPMPPREDASLLSLCLAPLAHLASSMFLLVASVFYAIMSVLDVLWNDKMATSCIVETCHLVRSCGAHLWRSLSSDRKEHFFSRIMDASKTFLVGLWYVSKCIAIRATYSKYANECLDACTGALRYSVYAIRSTHALWKRFTERAGGSRQNKKDVRIGTKSPVKKWSRKLHLSRVLSSISNIRAKQRYREQNLQIEQQRTRLEREYLDKLRALNQDRLLLERERRSLEEERSALICESLNLLAWCSAMAASESSAKDEPGEKGWSRWWKAWG